jgi:hypothetical protein
MLKKRQEIIIELQNFVSIYQSIYKRLPGNVESLTKVGMAPDYPIDPLGTVNFFIDPAGIVRFSQKK